MDPPRPLDAVQKCLVKYRNRRLADADPRTQCNMPQGVHHVRKIDVVRAPDRARMARGAYPYAPAGQHLLATPVLDLSYHLVGYDIHRRYHRTPRGALPALVAGPYVHPARIDHFLQKCTPMRLLRFDISHRSPHDPSFKWLSSRIFTPISPELLSMMGCISGYGVSKIVKVVPTPTLLFTSILLPWASMIP